MTHILSILRAAHCRSTHHYFALDALQDLPTAQAQRLANILLKYHDDYLVGAKAPDSDFKDFANHVIHVGDNYWGGAPAKCQEWLDQARQFLDQGKWKKAAYACGVLSHYFTDPIMPLHTAQHPREQAVHRPLEWSICKSYDEIFSLCANSGYVCKIELAHDDQWIRKAVLAAAEVANSHYDQLISNYDLAQGVVNPRAGLNDQAMLILAELFSLAIGGWSQVLMRLADETTSELPQVSLALSSVLASIDMPLAWIVRRLSDSQEHRAIKSLFKEYQRTGDLKRHLPSEIATIRKVKIANPSWDEVPQNQAVAPFKDPSSSAAAQASKMPDSSDASPEQGPSQDNHQSMDEPLVAAKAKVDRSDIGAEGADSTDSLATPQLVASSSGVMLEPIELTGGSGIKQPSPQALAEELITAREVADSSTPQILPLSQARQLQSYLMTGASTSDQDSSSQQRAISAVSSDSDVESVNEETRSLDRTRSTLPISPGTILPLTVHAKSSVHYDSPIIDAPSIGPKTAKRFENIGIVTIRQFLSADPELVASGMATRWITISLIQDWQDQARLVCEVPALSGYRAQLLVAVGCRTSWQLRTANPTGLHAQILQFCETSEGQQLLRSAQVPLAEHVVNWIESARSYARQQVA